jgi:Na+-driven multidrug efflux pump
MNRKQNLEVFAKTPVRKAVLLQIVPAVASQMVTLVYNLADTYFVGMLNAPMKPRPSLWPIPPF